MAGSRKQPVAATAASTGGSLISNAKLKQMYATMVQCRLLSDRARRLGKRNGSVALYEGSVGQEAIVTGCTIDLRPQDTIALVPHDSTTRLRIADLVKGLPLNVMIAELYADMAAKHPAPATGTPSANPEAQLVAATRVALANKQEKNANVVVAFTSQEATALGWWRQSLAFSVARSLPIIFVVENNRETPSAREAERVRANSNGLPRMTVDGNDVVAVYRVAHESLTRVRQGDGPVLIEGTRYLAHDSKPVQDDPLLYMERYLTAKKLFQAAWKDRVVAEFSGQLDAAVKAAQKTQRSLRK